MPNDLRRWLDQLAARRVPGFAADRTGFTAWLLEGERLFSQIFDASDPLLTRYKAAVERHMGARDLGTIQAAIGAFEACKSVVGNMNTEELARRGSATFAQKPEHSAAGQLISSSVDPIRLFISHSSVDARLAELVVRLFRSALGLPPSAIRCTSVDGYRLPAGADTDDQLRKEVGNAHSLVGIISMASLDSLYVAFELGARWGGGKGIVPLMAPGVRPEALRGPLGGKNALKSDVRAQLQQLVTDVGRELAIAPFDAPAYEADIEAILHFSAEQSVLDERTVAQRPPTIAQPIPAGYQLLQGIVWDMRGGSAIPYCEGCRTGTPPKWVGLSCTQEGSSLYGVRRYTCPHRHPEIVLSHEQPAPMTSAQMEQVYRSLNPRKT